MIFVDTSAWYAALIPRDCNHDTAARWLRAIQERLVTTDYVIDELLTLLGSRGHIQPMLHIGQKLFSGEWCHLEWLTHQDVHDAWDVRQQFHDKDWSFTDCTSRVVMGRLDIPTAFTFDDHFRQFGGVTVVPEMD